MKKLLLVLAFMLLCSYVFAEFTLKKQIQRCDPEEFLIMPWGIYGNTVDYDKFYQELYECGFNTTPFNFAEHIDQAKAHNLKFSLYAEQYIDNNIKDEAEKYADWAEKVKKVINGREKDIYQILVQDEPNEKDIERLKAKSHAVKSLLGMRPYINFLPKHAIEDYRDTPYEDYCNKFLNECEMSYLSYDSYCFYANRGFYEDDFYADMESIRKMAEERNMNFVNIILSVAHFNYAEPDDYSINLQGWSTLAYGGRGLSYFTFTHSDYGNYRTQAYYKDDTRTPLWYTIRDMNMTVHTLMPYYRNMKPVNQFHIGNIPKNARGIETAKVVKNIKAVYENDPKKTAKYNPPAQANILVGEFTDNDGNEYAIVVNKDQNWSVYLSEIEFKNGKKITRIVPSDERFTEPERDYKGEDRWIAPGHGVLLKGEVSKEMTFEAMDDWKFMKDPENQGEKKGYMKPDFKFDDWQKIDVNKAWEETIGAYDGYGWYKTQAEFKDEKSVYLFIGAVDEDAWVYVNGKPVLDHSRKTLGLTGGEIWNMPFAVNIKPYLKKGKNDITVKVKDDMNAGGIWRGVSAVYSSQDKTAEDIIKFYSK